MMAGRKLHKLLINSILQFSTLLLCALGLQAEAQESTAIPPARIVREYAVTCSNAREKYADPRNWRLLGSADNGAHWTLLDAQSNQVFRTRSERRVYRIPNRDAFSTYRWEIDSAGPIQAAELEFSGPWVGVTNEEIVRIIATASKPHPLLGVAAEAFDRDPNTRWIDFGTPQNSHWLQCEYTWDAQTLVTNIGQMTVVARRLAAHNPLGSKAGDVLASYTNGVARPTRLLSGYALTSANDMPNRDPFNWRLLGSTDHGTTWHTLDVRRNETFAQRYQRRIFFLTNEAPYSTYRLQIDQVRVPADQPGGASCVQLAEVEPIYSVKDSGGNYTMVVLAEAENPPMEAVEHAFDGKARTKWLSFTMDDNANRSSWVQWEYIPGGGDPPAVNLRWLKGLQNHRPELVTLSLQGVVFSWEPSKHRLGLLDTTGFQEFDLGTFSGAVQVGTRVRLTGQLELGSQLPAVSGAKLENIGSLAGPEQFEVGHALTNGTDFFIGQTEATVSSISEDSFGRLTLGLKCTKGEGRMQAKLWDRAARLEFFDGCRVRVSGIVQQSIDEAGHSAAGAIWVPDASHLSFVDLAEKDWSAWRLYSPRTLARTNGLVIPGEPVRASGRVEKLNPDFAVLGDGTNQVRVYTSHTNALAMGERIEALGVFTRENDLPALRGASVRTARLRTPDAGVDSTNEVSTPITDIKSIYHRLDAQPGQTFPVTVRGVITYIDLEFDSFYIQDDSAGITVVNQLDAGLAPLVREEGTFVEVRGNVDPDLQAVVPDGFVAQLGKGRMPTPRQHSWDYLVTGRDDAQWVQIEGMVAACTDTGLNLIMAGGRLPVVINDFDLRKTDRLLGSVVRINGVCQPLRDNRNHRIGLQLLVPYMECVEVLRPAPEDPFEQPTRKISELDDQRTRGTNQTVQLVKTVGLVTYREPRLLFLQDGDEGLRVLLRNETAAKVGDRVEVVGLVEPDGFSPKLTQAVARRVGSGPLAKAEPLDLSSPNVTDHDALRVQVDGTLVGQTAGKFIQLLELTSPGGEKTFSASVPVLANELPAFAIGSRLKLTGVFKSEIEMMSDFGQMPTAFRFYVDSPQSITVITQPSWWTARHTLWVAAALSTILLLALTWASSLRRQVQQRTVELHQEIAGHKQTEEALETSERFLRSLIASLPQSIVRKDATGRFTFANEFFCKTIGRPLDQILGKTDFDLFPEPLAKQYQRDDQEVIAKGKSLDFVEENRNSEGENIYVQVIKSPLFDAENKITGVQVVFWDVTERKRAEARAEQAQKAMVDASRQAGMAEVAAGVLHNVGNVLNSVNVSANLVSDRLHRSRTPGLAKAVALLREQEADLPGFFAKDPRANQLVGYLSKLADCLAEERNAALQEVDSLKQNIEHIKGIVTMQQSYARVVGVAERVKVTELVEDALRLNLGTLSRHEFELKREYDPELPEIVVEKHKVLQILVNLIRNAKYACDEAGLREKRLTVRVRSVEGTIQISTADNGVGIAPENLTRIFNHGFTTRKDGHGFGLHSGALAAKEMGGTLVAHSEGPGKGATFTLSLPLTVSPA